MFGRTKNLSHCNGNLQQKTQKDKTLAALLLKQGSEEGRQAYGNYDPDFRFT